MPLYVYSQFLADESGKVFWGTRGSGLLFVRNHPTLGFQVLLVKRSPHVEQPGTFGVSGGAVEEGEDEFESAVRETQEEIGSVPPCHKINEYVWRNPGGSFTFKTFIMEVEDMNWMPKAFNWEVTGAKWVTTKQMNSINLHPGFRDLVDAGGIKNPDEGSQEDLPLTELKTVAGSSWLSKVAVYNPVVWQDWPYRKGTGDDPREQDTPPIRTANGDFILFHGTSLKRAKQIADERMIRPDNWGTAGVNTTASNAGTYAAMKASKEKDRSAVLRLVVDKSWLMQQEITREVGGNGRDSWLISGEIPSAAIKQISIERISGDADWKTDHPDLVEQYGPKEASAVQPPKVIIMSFFPGYMKVLIGDKVYEYEAQENDKNKIENSIRNNARNQALRYLSKLKVISRPSMQVKASATGDCFRMAARWAMLNDADLVHGLVTNGEGRTFDHAWCEKDGNVIDLTTLGENKPMEKQKWYSIVNAVPKERYKHNEIARLMIKNKNWGPW